MKQSSMKATPEMVKAAYAAYDDDEIIKRADDWLEAVINAALEVCPALNSNTCLTNNRKQPNTPDTVDKTQSSKDRSSTQKEASSGSE